MVNKYKEDTQEKNNIDKKIIDLKKVIDSYKISVSEIEKEIKVINFIINIKFIFIRIILKMKM